MKASIDTLLSRGAGSFVAGHDRWIVEGRIDPGCRSAHEHRVLAKVLDLAQSRDGANITNFSSFEYVNRRRQLLEEAHREDPAKPCFDGTHYYMGEDEEVPGLQIDSNLKAHIASEFARDAAIAKERRKAKEATGKGASGKKEKGDK